MTGQMNIESNDLSNHRLSVKTTTDEELERMDNTLSRAQSMCDDTSSELQRVASLDPNGLHSQSSFQGRGALSRLVRMVVTLREWAHKSLQEEEQRPDSFLERFRGPELRAIPSRVSNSQQDQEKSDSKGTDKKKKEVFVLDPAENLYNHWLLIIAIPVLYNWCMLIVREWAHKSLQEEEQRPDSFLERFRGPELRAIPSRVSNSQQDQEKSDSKGKDKKKKEVFVLDPAENLYNHWLLIIAIPVLYNWCMLIVRACFDDLQTENYILWLVLDYVSDALYIMDTFVRLRTD
ncbi:Cyclic nucleotide-gated olfactory channel [Acipenser ruthenus]|uniref:Cyclic nucleotide-gated olfactory channel n=1 Tax=Acipenser ruthenus TaxID=7906 RepID=A0A444V387_ACIRT|nr:Cyclic nucleotide-gated olfactory channel [Acipenser ruthenus]